jgi:hypothetical protein
VRLALARTAACLLLAAPPPAFAAESQYSPFEQDTIREALEKVGGRIDPMPDGKRIEAIEIVTLEVFDERDPVPDFFNVFHATTRHFVVRRELLFSDDQAYDPARIAESARKLREIRQISFALIVPMQGSSPDSVRVLVITKDIWSLRLNSNFQIADGKLVSLLLQPAEENLFGTHLTVAGLFVLRPDTYSFGAVFKDPRVAGSRIQSALGANLIFNRETGSPEGSYGSFAYGQPLYAAEAEWAWQTLLVWRDRIFRRYDGTRLVTYNARVTPGVDDAVPYVYDEERWFGAYTLTRSFGRRFKHDLSGGAEVDRRRYAPPPPPPGIAPAAIAEFERTQLPVSDTRVSPFVEVRSYTSDYRQILDFNTLGLQEDYRLGAEAVVRAYPAARAAGSTRDLLGLFSALGYTLPFGDGLVRAIGAHTIELSTPEQSDALLEADLRVVTPRLVLGRFVYDVEVANRHQNYYNERFTLGGAGRLRGYSPGAFFGKDFIAQNVEFRTRPVEILSAQLGAALFHDLGDAFDGFDRIELKQSAGFGVRALFPQAERIVFRIDWGFPLTDGYNTFPGSLFATFGQAFDMPTVPPPTLAASYPE